ncbi:hypothetical protein D9M68_851470 [compost metagenome]
MTARARRLGFTTFMVYSIGFIIRVAVQKNRCRTGAAGQGSPKARRLYPTGSGGWQEAEDNSVDSPSSGSVGRIFYLDGARYQQ